MSKSDSCNDCNPRGNKRRRKPRRNLRSASATYVLPVHEALTGSKNANKLYTAGQLDRSPESTHLTNTAKYPQLAKHLHASEHVSVCVRAHVGVLVFMNVCVCK